MYKLTAVKKDYQKGRGVVACAAGRRPGHRRTASGSPSRGRPGTASRRCCRCWAASTGRHRAASSSATTAGRTWPQLRESQVTKVRAESIGFIFQTFNLVPTLSAQENVETALVPLHVSAHGATAARRERARRRRPGRPGQAPAVGAVRRAAAARRDRAGPGQAAQGAAGRRADREPGRGHQGRDHRPAGEAVA